MAPEFKDEVPLEGRTPDGIYRGSRMAKYVETCPPPPPLAINPDPKGVFIVFISFPPARDGERTA